MILENVLFMTSEDNATHRDCLNAVLTEIQSALSSFEFSDVVKGAPSLAIRKHFENSIAGKTWQRKQGIHSEVPRSLGRTNFEVDFLKTFRNNPCGRPHQVAFEFAFDNRQAIGSNLLKLEVASRKFSEAQNQGNLGFGILICPGDSALSARGWDPAVGVSAEYEVAIREGYRDILTSNRAVIVIR